MATPAMVRLISGQNAPLDIASLHRLRYKLENRSVPLSALARLMNLSFVSSSVSFPIARIASKLARASVLAGAVLLAACQTQRGPAVSDEPVRPAAEILAEGLANVNAHRYRSALENFAQLDQYYPYSDEDQQGMVLTVVAHYQSNDYQEAIDAANRYLLAYPTQPDAAYVLFLLGESHLRMVPDITRDQGAARDALQADQELLARFPNSEYAAQARLNVIAIRDQLAGQEMLIGRYYEERREYPGAINRFRVVVTDYQDTRHVEEALFRLAETYLAMGLVSEAQTAAAILGYNFPDSVWYDEAYSLLGTAGVVPNNSGRGWLADLFPGRN
jgi:outer membrane protein assembly factor BamD